MDKHICCGCRKPIWTAGRHNVWNSWVFHSHGSVNCVQIFYKRVTFFVSGYTVWLRLFGIFRRATCNFRAANLGRRHQSCDNRHFCSGVLIPATKSLKKCRKKCIRHIRWGQRRKNSLHRSQIDQRTADIRHGG